MFAALFMMTMRMEPADPANYLKPVILELQRPWPTNRTINIVFHGHSVPAGYFATPAVHTQDAYPHLVHVVLGDRFPTAVINVIVTAIGGENSVQGAKRFKADVLSHKPDVLFIDYGLNDRGVPLEQSKAAWLEMVSLAKASHIKVLLLTPTPDLTSKMLESGDPLSQQAKQIREVAAQEGVGLVDSYGAFCDRLRAGQNLQPLMAQSNHPNRLGHEIVADLALKWFPK